ncbi:DIS3-like exonuclease 1 [Branchiostoma floridae]|uniref:DIS3-like exonuclease 1 n=1 Tax=Branchiostoma floridae TaxID=7739 RepID=A0A9J7MH59_BRAFL|nr:DIS3-like exonuclease 1 [Branchiostoma floridae]
MIKTEKHLRLKTGTGRTVRVVREHYLRDDVSCNSRLCMAECRNEGPGLLPKGVTHYVVPDCQVTRDYLEILEFPEIRGVLFTGTVVHSMQHQGGRRAYGRLRTLLRDPRQECAVFANEFQQYAYCPREHGETLEKWQSRSTYKAAEWYYNHLAGQIPVVVLSEDPQIQEEYGPMTPGVFVVNMGEYLNNFWPDLQAAHDIYESLVAGLQEKGKSTGSKEYKDYLPVEVVEAGIKSGRYLRGNLQVNKHRAQQEAFVRMSSSSGGKDVELHTDVIVVGTALRNRAVHGDTVAVELLPRSEWRGRSTAITDNTEGVSSEAEEESNSVMPTGKVVTVMQRNWRDYVCSFAEDEGTQGQKKNPGKVLVIPFDYRIPKIRISTRQADQLKDHRIVVRIDSWEADSQYPNGHFVRSLGPSGDLETETAALLVENSISVALFSEGQVKELPTNTEESPWVMQAEEVARRRDLRHTHLIFSIDPIGCEDVDDTLSIRKLPNGHLELGVHIADVTYFVKPNSLTDLEAKARATTVYLADRRYDMLPSILSADLCSLLGSVDRYAMSVLWELDSNYEVLDVWYGRTIIRSAYKMFYEAAQAVHDRKPEEELIQSIPELQELDTDTARNRLEQIRWAVDSLMDIADHLRAGRLREGGLELEGVEVQVQLGDSKEIQKLVPKQPLAVHETVAECMIFANHWVAKRIAEAFPNNALLRHHPLPRQEHFESLVECAKAQGFSIDTSSNKALAESLDKCVNKDDPVVNKLLRTLATQAMSNAQYFSTGSLPRDQYFHYGLALDQYTHFTSPIRRYADVIVHRLLLAAIGVEDERSAGVIKNQELEELSQHINNRNRAAQHAQRASTELFQALYFKDKDPEDECCIADAVIFSLRTNGVLLFVPKYGVKGPLYLKDKDGLVVCVEKDGTVSHTSGTLTRKQFEVVVQSTKGSATFRLFQHLTVRLSLQKSRAHPQTLTFSLVAAKPYKPDLERVKGESSAPARTDVVKEVKSSSADTSTSHGPHDMTAAMGSEFPELLCEYGQSRSCDTLYGLMEVFREMSLAEA